MQCVDEEERSTWCDDPDVQEFWRSRALNMCVACTISDCRERYAMWRANAVSILTDAVGITPLLRLLLRLLLTCADFE